MSSNMLSPAIESFRRCGQVTQGKLSLQHVPQVCTDLEEVGKSVMNYCKAVTSIRKINALASVFCFVYGVVLIFGIRGECGLSYSPKLKR